MTNTNVVPLIKNEWYFTALNGVDGESFTRVRQAKPEEFTRYQPFNDDPPLDKFPELKILSIVIICVLLTIENRILIGYGLTKELARDLALKEYKINGQENSN